MSESKRTRRVSRGKCFLCEGNFSKSGMTRHLDACLRENAPEVTADRRRPRATKFFHLVVEGHYLPMYWMHLAVPQKALLEDLDRFLRRTWLECCGHLSAFDLGGTTYQSHPEWTDDVGMDVALGKLLGPGVEFDHEYDFGTTTHLTLRVVSEREEPMRGKSIQILARNDPPSIPCELCGKEAAHICTECLWAGAGWLCEECAEEHECGEEMLLPVVNSPRVGMCGYTG